MTEAITHLTNNAITELIKQHDDQESIIVQIVDLQQKKDKYYYIISDGNFMIKSLPKDQAIVDSSNDLNAIIKIKRHMTAKNVVGIVDYQKLFNYKERIGNPQEYATDSINPQNLEKFKIQKSMIKGMDVQTAMKTQPLAPKKQVQSTAQKTAQPYKKVAPIISNPIPLKGNINDYQTIKMLYIGMDRWTIICRIVKKDFKQFISKKSGKQVKVLNIELMDRAGMKISGQFFGESAQKFNDELTKDRVYKISKGQIRQESYNNSKNDKISPYKLVFTNLSQFQQVSDTSSIANNQDAAITLGQCIDKRILGQEFDIIYTIEVKKDDGILKKTNLLLADPIKNITLHAVVWNQNLIPSSNLVGKAIILSRFKLTEYKNALTLGSLYKSSIIPVTNHYYQKYENEAMTQYNNYEKLHEIKSSGNSQYNQQLCQTIKELEQKIEKMNEEEWARADLTVCINRFALKKWHYEGCPHCNKAAESLSNCTHCQKYVDKTVGHFIMGVEICDSTGSLWTTAYDEWAKKIFNVSDQSVIIQHLMKLDANQLRQQSEAYLYQQYRLRISTKKDKQGKIKHHVSKVHDRDIVDETMKNIELISKLSIS